MNAKRTIFANCKWIGFFREGLAAVEGNDGKAFHINTNWKPAYKARYDFVGDFSNGLAKVSKNGKYFYINSKGQRKRS